MHWVLETTKCTALPTPSHEPATCGPEIWSHSSPERPSHLNTVTNNRNGIVIGTIIPPTSSECESHLLCVVSPVPVRLIPLAWPWLGCTGDHYHVLPGTSTSQWHEPSQSEASIRPNWPIRVDPRCSRWWHWDWNNFLPPCLALFYWLPPTPERDDFSKSKPALTIKC